MDLISRQAAIDEIAFSKEMLNRVLDDMDVVGVDREKYAWGLGLIESLIDDIEELPSAQPEQRTGKWLMRPDPYGFFEEIPVCSGCGCTTKWREKYLYCPNCGAKMEVNTDATD